MKITLDKEDLVNMFASAFKVKSVIAESDEEGNLDQIVIDVETSLTKEELNKDKILDDSPEFG